MTAGPGQLDASVVLQDDYWQNIDGERIPLDRIGVRYAQNIIRYLERRADEIELRVAAGIALSNAAGSLCPDTADALMTAIEQDAVDPLGWLRRTPLHRALSVIANDGDPGYWTAT